MQFEEEWRWEKGTNQVLSTPFEGGWIEVDLSHNIDIDISSFVTSYGFLSDSSYLVQFAVLQVP
jgi:hypothetical protein